MSKLILLTMLILSSSLSFAFNDIETEQATQNLISKLKITRLAKDKLNLIENFKDQLYNHLVDVTKADETPENLDKSADLSELDFYLDVVDFSSINSKNCLQKQHVIKHSSVNVDYENESDVKLPYMAQVSLEIVQAYCQGLK